jgi:methenyltetrahydromethanopterin cyclohydrolase
MDLNQRAAVLVGSLLTQSHELRIDCTTADCGARIIDFGIGVEGGLGAGLALATVCLADLGQVTIHAASSDGRWGPRVQVVTDHPVLACLASQYAGWRVAEGKYFAMLSGPVRAAAAKEPIFEKLKAWGCTSVSDTREAIGVLEARQIPPDAVCIDLARQAGVAPEALTLLIAPTASLAGGMQVVARSVETALHKMAELGFDLSTVKSGHGMAPLPPPAKDDLTAIGRTNDAILYGAEVTVWTRGGDSQIDSLGERVPSCASSDFGRPFAEIFSAAGHDFYKIDPHLFSPAIVNFISLETGRTWRFGELRYDVLERSFTS